MNSSTRTRTQVPARLDVARINHWAARYPAQDRPATHAAPAFVPGAETPPWLRAYLLFGRGETDHSARLQDEGFERLVSEERRSTTSEEEWLPLLQEFHAAPSVFDSLPALTDDNADDDESSLESVYDALYHLRAGRPPLAPNPDDPLHRFTFEWLIAQHPPHDSPETVLANWLDAVEDTHETREAAELEAARRGPPGPTPDGRDFDWASVVGEEASTSLDQLEHLLREELGLSEDEFESSSVFWSQFVVPPQDEASAPPTHQSSDNQGEPGPRESNGAVPTANGQDDATALPDSRQKLSEEGGLVSFPALPVLSDDRTEGSSDCGGKWKSWGNH